VDISQNQFSLQLFSFTTSDTAVYFCEWNPVRVLQCELRHKPPWGHRKMDCKSHSGSFILVSQAKSRCSRENRGLPKEVGGFLSSPTPPLSLMLTFFILSHAISHAYCRS
jgi:hypothetical protein